MEMRRFKGKKLVIILSSALVGYFSLGCAILFFERVEGNTCLPSSLQDKLHGDYPHGLRWVPRSSTSWCMVQPPTLALGNQTNYFLRKGSSGPEAIPAHGSWQISFVRVREKLPFFLPYLAVTTQGGWHMRLGCRWDQKDGYYTFPSGTIKKIK